MVGTGVDDEVCDGDGVAGGMSAGLETGVLSSESALLDNASGRAVAATLGLSSAVLTGFTWGDSGRKPRAVEGLRSNDPKVKGSCCGPDWLIAPGPPLQATNPTAIPITNTERTPDLKRAVNMGGWAVTLRSPSKGMSRGRQMLIRMWNKRGGIRQSFED